MKVEVVRTSDFDIASMVARSSHPEGEEVVRDFVKRSLVVFVGKADGVEACVVGLIPETILSDRAYLWMLHTDICEAHPLRFVRWSRRVIAELPYRELLGHCVNATSRQWLEWLGAEFVNENSFRIARDG